MEELWKLTWFEVKRGERLRVQEVEGGSDREQHVVVVPLVQDDQNQIAYLETEANKQTKTPLVVALITWMVAAVTVSAQRKEGKKGNTHSRMAILSECREDTDDML